MLFELTNTIFYIQRFIFKIFNKYIKDFITIYLDDIIIFLNILKEHIEHNKKIIKIFQSYGIPLKLKKCEFHVQRTEILGHEIIAGQGMQMQRSKLKSILEWPIPTNINEVRQFTGLTNYYQEYIKGYGDIVELLTRLTRKGIEFQWKEEQINAFEELKRKFEEDNILITFDYEEPVEIHTDASDKAIGAQLIQKIQGKERTIPFYSRQMLPAEQRYDIHNKELLAIKTALEHWRVYLEGSKYSIIVKSDHRNLIYFLTIKKLTRRQARWAEELSKFDFKIEHVKGRENIIPDILSR